MKSPLSLVHCFDRQCLGRACKARARSFTDMRNHTLFAASLPFLLGYVFQKISKSPSSPLGTIGVLLLLLSLLLLSAIFAESLCNFCIVPCNFCRVYAECRIESGFSLSVSHFELRNLLSTPLKPTVQSSQLANISFQQSTVLRFPFSAFSIKPF